MRTDKELLIEAKCDSEVVEKQEKPNWIIILLSLLPFIALLTIILSGLIIKADMLDLMKVGVLAFLLTTALSFFIRMNENILDIKFSKSILLIPYMVSIVLVMLPKNPEIYSFWMIGALLITMLIDKKLGFMVYFILTFILSIIAYLSLDATIHLLIMGLLFTLLSGFLRNKSTVIYASIILLSSNITLSFIMNNFIFETNNNASYLASFFSILAVLLTTYFLSFIYDLIVREDNTNGEFSASSIAIVDNSENITPLSHELALDRSMKTSYDVLLSESNELLVRIKEHSEALYKHSLLIGDLSGSAAKIIDADDELARAGGYYHEVGKIIGKNYIEESLKLADEYSFPEELRSILRQHSIKNGKPNSVEAAIVMMSDNVVSTIDYIKKTGDNNFTTDKIIDNIFKMRMEKGNFDNSGISIKNFKLLKEFYQNEYRRKDVEDKGIKEDTH